MCYLTVNFLISATILYSCKYLNGIALSLHRYKPESVCGTTMVLPRKEHPYGIIQKEQGHFSAHGFLAFGFI